MQIITIKLSQISGLHPASSEILSATADLIYASGPSDVNEEAIKLLADIHPVHVVPRSEKYQVVAGFRIYELCKLLVPNDEIRCIVHQDKNKEKIKQLAEVDILGSPLVHSLGTKYVQQIRKLTRAIGNDNNLLLFPKLKSIRRICE